MIDDPLAQFYKEETSENAGAKNPTTGLREPYDLVAKQKLKNDEIERRNIVSKRVITTLMNDEFGREWLYGLLETCNVFGTPYTIDPQATAYNSGALYIGRLVESDIKVHAIKEYILMLEEAMNRNKIWDEQVGTV